MANKKGQEMYFATILALEPSTQCQSLYFILDKPERGLNVQNGTLTSFPFSGQRAMSLPTEINGITFL